MKELLFRTFVDRCNSFFYWDGSYFKSEELLKKNGLDICINWYDIEDELKDFYIGKKDLKGICIYTGDILKVIHLNDWNSIYWNQPTGPAIPTLVRWNENSLCIECPYDTHNFVKIGNKYQNQELLKECRN